MAGAILAGEEGRNAAPRVGVAAVAAAVDPSAISGARYALATHVRACVSLHMGQFAS